MNAPLVSCICPTMESRRSFLPQLIASFQLQTIANRELILIGDDVIFDPAIPRNDPRIRTIPLTDTLGAKRNAGCLAAQGAIIAHFDDDDYSAPDRLAHQVELLESSGKAVAGYYSILFRETRHTNVITEDGKRPGAEWWKWTSSRKHACGTSLCFRRDWWVEHPFPSVTGGEDDQFYAEARLAGQAVAFDGSARMYATNHMGNVSGRLIGGAEWEELPGRPEWLKD